MSVDAFWSYVSERYAIWTRRADGLPPPWTDDPILAGWRFPNVFRYLDPGTKMRNDIINQMGLTDFMDEVVATTAYRLIQRRSTIEELGLPTHDTVDAWSDRIRERRAQGIKVSSGLNAPRPLEHDLRAIKMVGYAPLEFANNGMIAHEMLKDVFSIGVYYGSQILADLLGSPRWHLDESEMVPLGHGARRGLLVVMTGEVALGTHTRAWRSDVKLGRQEMDVYKHLCDDQPDFGVRRLWPHEVEQNLCELGRYWQIKNGRAGHVHVGRYHR